MPMTGKPPSGPPAGAGGSATATSMGVPSQLGTVVPVPEQKRWPEACVVQATGVELVVKTWVIAALAVGAATRAIASVSKAASLRMVLLLREVPGRGGVPSNPMRCLHVKCNFRSRFAEGEGREVRGRGGGAVAAGGEGGRGRGGGARVLYRAARGARAPRRPARLHAALRPRARRGAGARGRRHHARHQPLRLRRRAARRGLRRRRAL